MDAWNEQEYNGSVMRHAARKILQASGRFLGETLDDWLPPGVEPEDLDDWRPDPPSAYCPRCGASAGEGAVTPRGCAFCLTRQLPWQRLTRLSLYGPPMDAWIRDMKFHRRWRYTEWMGSRLAEVLGPPNDAHATVVCAVPMPQFRRWRRGYNQADLLGKAVAKALGLRLIPVLKRIRHTPPQTAIPPSRRHENIRKSFAIDPIDLSGLDVILVDDVKTSGATLGACARQLTRAGARSIHAAVVVVADPKGQGFQAS